VAAGITQSSNIEIEASDDEEEDEDDEDDSGSKTIYIKTEPGGKIVFGSLDDEQTDLLFEALESEEMSEDLLELRFNSYGDFREYEGVVNEGDEGDFGHTLLSKTIDLIDDGFVHFVDDDNILHSVCLVCTLPDDRHN
jgi:hypothetical protein